MTEAQRAHQRLLETMPRERIRTHQRAEAVAKVAAQRRRASGMPTGIPRELLERYVRLRNAGRRFLDMKSELCVSTRTMVRLRDKAMQEGLLTNEREQR